MENGIRVDDMTWYASSIGKHKTSEAFVKAHMADTDIYPRHTSERKENALKIVWDAFNPKKAAPDKE
jgi:hypothetical protein